MARRRLELKQARRRVIESPRAALASTHSNLVRPTLVGNRTIFVREGAHELTSQFCRCRRDL
jgi:hypothetical protein